MIAINKIKIILILGCGRSGTSCLAGMLADQGIDDCNSSKKHRRGLTPKGSYENMKLSRFHHNSFKWFYPEKQLPWVPKQKDTARKIIEPYRNKYPVFIKDPKMLINLDNWLELIDPVILGTFRHPDLVVDSMMRRKKSNPNYPYATKNKKNKTLTTEWGYAIWEYYNLQLLHYHSIFKFPIINFDSKTYVDDVRIALNQIGVEVVSDFTMFEEQYRHTTTMDKCSNKLLQIYNNLKDIAVAS